MSHRGIRPARNGCTTSSQTNTVHLQKLLTTPLACRTATFALRSVRMWHARPLPKRGSRFHASLCLLDTLGVCAKQVCTSLDRTCQETTLVSRLALGHGQMKKTSHRILTTGHGQDRPQAWAAYRQPRQAAHGLSVLRC